MTLPFYPTKTSNDGCNGDTATIASIITRLAGFKKSQKQLVFFNVPESIKSIIEISKVEQLFAICKTEQEALEAIR